MILDWIAMSLGFKTSLKDWWLNNKNGREEKSTMISEENILIIDKLIDMLEDKINEVINKGV